MFLLLGLRATPGALPPPIALADFTDQIYTDRQVIQGNTTFRRCTFRGCQSGSNSGGALNFNTGNGFLRLDGCLFESCAASSGGGFYVDRCPAFFMTETAGLNCSASTNLFCSVGVFSSSPFDVRELSIACCTGVSATVSFSYQRLGQGVPSCFECVNSSANEATGYGSGIGPCLLSDPSFRFWVLSRNAHANCLSLVGGSYWCVAMSNNSCQSGRTNPGLIYASSSPTLSNSVFQSNTFDYFVGRGWSGFSVLFTFIGCVFDISSFSATGVVSFSTTNCTYAAQPTSLTACRPRSPGGTPVGSSPTDAAGQTPNPTASACFDDIAGCCARDPDADNCSELIIGCSRLALEDEHDPKWGNEDDHQETCMAYCGALPAGGRPSWCGEPPASKKGISLGVVIVAACIGAVVLAAVIVIVAVFLRRRHPGGSESDSSDSPFQLEDANVGEVNGATVVQPPHRKLAVAQQGVEADKS
jgi:hypothetical protein